MMADGKPWHKRYHSDALTGYMGLSLELRGAYTTFLDLLYDRGEPLVDNERLMAGYLNCSVRKYRALRDDLISLGKIRITDEGKITNKRFEKELENVAKTSRKRKIIGAKGGEKSAEVRKKTNKNNGRNEAKASSEHQPKMKPYARDLDARSQSIDISSTVSNTESYPDRPSTTQQGRFAFCGKVIKLTESDFQAWVVNFANIPDLKAELQARDDYLSQQPEPDRRRWFMSTSSYLRNRNDQYAERNTQQQAAGGGFAC